MGTLIYTVKTSMGRIQPASWPYLEIGMGSGKGPEGPSPWCGLGRGQLRWSLGRPRGPAADGALAEGGPGLQTCLA